jgi:hypothetical protein
MLEIVTFLAAGIIFTSSPDKNRALNQLGISYAKEVDLEEKLKNTKKRIKENFTLTRDF